MNTRTVASVLIAAAVAAACETRPPDTDAPGGLPEAQERFWTALQDLCGQAFEGQLVERVPPDDVFTGRHLVMHVRECEDDVIRIPFHVGEDRSRTWVLSRTEDGLRLKHDHRHEDGSDEDLTWYGGDTDEPGTATTQEFPADQETADMLPEAATNVWTVEVHPTQMFAYALRREGTERRLRVEFDLTRPVDAPPPPWGS
jgi:hypothetical protein